MTAIFLSFILIAVTATLNEAGYFTRSSFLDAEYKERSNALAEACANVALLSLAARPNYTGAETVAVGGESCEIRPVKSGVPAPGRITIETRGIFEEATTNLRIVLNTVDLSIISWNELPTF